MAEIFQILPQILPKALFKAHIYGKVLKLNEVVVLKKIFPCIALSVSVLFQQTLFCAQSTERSKEDCGAVEHAERVTLRHIEAGGIGYNKGYSTLEGFFTNPHSLKTSVIPFVDLRGHVFNDGKFAANAGAGVRYLTSRVWGLNAYYDYRNTHKIHYNQVAVGLESLGKIWDFRLNGYLPVGRKKSSFFQRKFNKFKGHSLIFSEKREFAMKGANGEVGLHFKARENIDCTLAAGPYYFEGEGKNAIGGEARFYTKIYEYVGLKVSGSYDKVFKGLVQGELSLNISFGPKVRLKERSGYPCSQEAMLRERALQPVERQEIIVVDRKRSHKIATDPLTGEPLSFIFVNNTNPTAGDGTFEDPFELLSSAETASNVGNILYLFKGDGTTTHMDTGITLKDNQQLLGSGDSHQVNISGGKITIPAFTSGSPQITKFIGTIAILANNNVVDGITFAGDGIVAGISGGLINNATITNNVFTNTFGGIQFFDPSGLLLVKNNTITNGSGNAISLEGFMSIPATMIASNNIIANISGNGILVSKQILNMFNVTITGNTITNCGLSGIEINTQTGPAPIVDATIANNAISGCNTGITISPSNGAHIIAELSMNTISSSLGDGILITDTTGIGSRVDISILSNRLSNNNISSGVAGVEAGVNPAGIMCLRLQGNSSINSSTPGYQLENPFFAIFNVESVDETFPSLQASNVGTFSLVGLINFIAPGTCLTP
jgi:trimeric autotransporter adhesin